MPGIAPSGNVLLIHDAYEVNPGTVCQYTGMTDKNGKKIFEGDIMMYHFLSARKKPRKAEYVVAWDEYGFLLFDEEYGFKPEDLEIIGNIHEKEANNEQTV